MKQVKYRYSQLMQSYTYLSYIAEKFVYLSSMYAKQPTCNDVADQYFIHRDALIKRFELCYDLTWKFFKILLRDH